MVVAARQSNTGATFKPPKSPRACRLQHRGRRNRNDHATLTQSADATRMIPRNRRRGTGSASVATSAIATKIKGVKKFTGHGAIDVWNGVKARFVRVAALVGLLVAGIVGIGAFSAWDADRREFCAAKAALDDRLRGWESREPAFLGHLARRPLRRHRARAQRAHRGLSQEPWRRGNRRAHRVRPHPARRRSAPRRSTGDDHR